MPKKKRENKTSISTEYDKNEQNASIRCRTKLGLQFGWTINDTSRKKIAPIIQTSKLKKLCGTNL